MRVGSVVFMAIVMLLSWESSARDEIDADDHASPGTCVANLGRAWACLERQIEAAMAPEAGEATGAAATDWQYPVGVGLFITGNAIAFSFPVWALLGADVTTVTGVIVAGEVLEVAGIIIMGEEAFKQLKRALREWAT